MELSGSTIKSKNMRKWPWVHLPQGFLNNCTCLCKIKRARRDRTNLWGNQKISNQGSEVPMVGAVSAEVLAMYRTQLLQLISLPEFLQFPVPPPYLWLSVSKISHNARSKAYINDERAWDERYWALWCFLKAPTSLSGSASNRSSWLHGKLHRAQQKQKWGISGWIPRKAPTLNSLFRNLLNIWSVCKQAYFPLT